MNTWDYPVVKYGSKLGVHGLTFAGIGNYARTLTEGGTSFPVVKAAGDMGWLAEIKAISPDTITVARIISPIEGCEKVGDASTNLDSMADRLVKLVLDKIAGAPGLRQAVDYWEICNEPDPPGTTGYARLGELMIKCMEKAEIYGLRLAILSLNVGTPEWDEMNALAESGVFARAKEGRHILALHEGVVSPDDPIDKWWNDAPPIPGAPSIENAGALCFRYRCLYHILEQRDEVIPLVISEWCGYDQRPHIPEETLDRVIWYDREARYDYYVLGFLPFTLGPVGQWIDCDYAKSYPTLLEYMIVQQELVNALPDEMYPIPNRGAPREQYRRTYVLLPPGADNTWAEAVVRATWNDDRMTVGGSADDAGIGDLDDRRVIAVNPHLWADDLAAFFQEYYRGVEYIPVVASTPETLMAILRQF